ncbi:protein of unknown function [Ruminococcaceae bacterium BL-4]|nr:protein of unknown function [Ruminococcaceae bacterium BL-4]
MLNVQKIFKIIFKCFHYNTISVFLKENLLVLTLNLSFYAI